MAQQKVVDLVVQHGAIHIVQHGGVEPSAPVRSKSDAPAASLVALGGAAAAGLGALTLALVPMLGLWPASLLLSMGAFLVVLGLARRHRVTPAPEPAAPRVDPQVLAERCRRVRAILRGGSGAYTFERLVQQSRWTKAAMLSTLLHMKERGEIVEDLNLDSGEWIYSLTDAIDGPSSATSPMLEERKALEGDKEGQG